MIVEGRGNFYSSLVAFSRLLPAKIEVFNYTSLPYSRVGLPENINSLEGVWVVNPPSNFSLGDLVGPARSADKADVFFAILSMAKEADLSNQTIRWLELLSLGHKLAKLMGASPYELKEILNIHHYEC